MNNFKNKIAKAKKILVVNPLYLGDAIHSLPVAALLKKEFPNAQIDFLAASHTEALFKIIPYVTDVMAVPMYPRPKSRLELYWRRIKVAWSIAMRRYDAVVNLKPIDSTGGTISISFARYKLAIRCMYAKTTFRWLYSDVIDNRWQNQSSYRFQLQGMADAGFDVSSFRLGPALVNLSGQDIPAEITAPYFHISLFASKDSRQLETQEARSLIFAILRDYPQHQLVITCASAQRELDELKLILPVQDTGRIKVFAGTLNIAQLAAVIAGADLHIGPDTGSVHLAWLVGAKTVSWYLNHDSLMGWVPYGPQHRVVLSVREQVRIGTHGETTRRIQAIKASHILEEIASLLSAALPPKIEWSASDHVAFRYVD